MHRARFVFPALAALASLIACEPSDPTIKVTPISVINETVGIGKPATKGDLVTVNYRIVTDEDREILSRTGYRFVLGTGAVIDGIDDAVMGMRITGKRTVKCPPHRHWGRNGYGDGDVPPNTTLIIQVDLQSID